MLAQKKPIERYSEPRYLARIAIFHGPCQKQILTNYSINMSTGGVFIESSVILPEDTELTVKFKLSNSDAIIVAKARVAWTNDQLSIKKETLPPGMGIQFLDLSLDDMHTIRVFLDLGNFLETW